MDALALALEKLGYSVDRAFTNHGVLVIKEFSVAVGQYAGQLVSVGIPATDFPFTAPAGLHVRPGLKPIGQNGINPSPLGPEWQYWSRRLTDWATDRSARHIVSYINKVLLEA